VAVDGAAEIGGIGVGVVAGVGEPPPPLHAVHVVTARIAAGARRWIDGVRGTADSFEHEVVRKTENSTPPDRRSSVDSGASRASRERGSLPVAG
jgi:hypothetical protein